MNFDQVIEFPVEKQPDEITLRLRRCVASRRESRKLTGDGRAALLLHGGNTSSDTFVLPTDGNNDGLAGFLANRGWQVWLLDYRASPFVQNLLATRPGGPLGGSALAECAFFTLDRIVDVDIPAALGKLRPYLGDADLSVLGHCIGGGTVATAIARGHFKSVRNVVLSALGLFYEVPWNGWVKVEDYLIERVLAEDPSCRGIDPKNRDAWPASMLGALGAWPAAWLPPVGKDWADLESYEKMLRLLTFMFGQPYFIEALHPTLRRQAIEPVFGNMHLGLYWHIGQMVRRGFVAEFDQPDVIDRLRLRKAGASPQGPVWKDIESAAMFKDKVVTLISGADNRLWHRDSMDLMYDWLHTRASGGTGAFYKQAHRGYGLQEIMWGTRAAEEVFPGIEQGLLGRRAEAPRPESVTGQGA